MSGVPARLPSGDLVPGRIKWIAVAGFAVIVVGGALPGNPNAPAVAVAAAVTVAAAGALVYGGRLPLLAAAVATAGIAVEGDGLSSDIGWLAACLLAGWCVIVVSQRVGLIYWAAIMILFAAEWLWVRPDPGWGAWLAGSTLTVLCALLIRHQIDLNAQLRAAQAGLAEQARTAERNRIARELHDVIGHTLVVSLLHVQSARLAVEHDPADAARALAEAERLGRECLAEVRLTVGMLREEESRGASEGAMAPLPGVDGAARAGRAVPVGGRGHHPRRGRRYQRPARHHGPGRVPHRTGGADQRGEARAGRADRGAADGRSRAGDADCGQPGRAGQRGQQPGTGLGVVSMRERAESLGGTCEAGPGGQGWLVRATLPLDASLRAQ